MFLSSSGLIPIPWSLMVIESVFDEILVAMLVVEFLGLYLMALSRRMIKSSERDGASARTLRSVILCLIVIFLSLARGVIFLIDWRRIFLMECFLS